ncbi:MAG TPA: hypothetical protein VMU38_01655 [Candidatus Binatia bacterium]|nr:hypothetical protein [Candidatus Binatia bacterium]
MKITSNLGRTFLGACAAVVVLGGCSGNGLSSSVIPPGASQNLAQPGIITRRPPPTPAPVNPLPPAKPAPVNPLPPTAAPIPIAPRPGPLPTVIPD